MAAFEPGGHVSCAGFRSPTAIGSPSTHRPSAIGKAALAITLPTSEVSVLVSGSTLLCCRHSFKMVWPRDGSGKRKASPALTAAWEVDVAALRQHRRAEGERCSKAREDTRRVPNPRGRDTARRASPPPKRGRVIEVTSSEEDPAPEGEHSGGMTDRERSCRYVYLSLPYNSPPDRFADAL